MAEMAIGERDGVVVAPGGVKDLVRGQEQELVALMSPLVRREDVSLDLEGVERIDAAGLSALITLYRDAHKAGHAFTVTRARRHVREILGLVGLDRILEGGEAEERPLGARLKQSVA